MANENWEEISEWEIEEDIDLAQRITVHAVRSIDEEEEYQLVQAYKHPTYAAATKWGVRKSSSSNDEEASKSNNKTPSEVKKKSTKKKSTTSSDEETSKSNKASSAKKKVSKDEDDSIKDNILKGDHDVDYDTSDFTSDTKNRKETRRTNSKLHKIQSHKLMSSLISNTELELNQDLVKGDTNRDPEFKRYKLLKKSMALNKKYTEKSKSDRKVEKLRVEVW